jgi:hypothetical protein
MVKNKSSTMSLRESANISTRNSSVQPRSIGATVTVNNSSVDSTVLFEDPHGSLDYRRAGGARTPVCHVGNTSSYVYCDFPGIEVAVEVADRHGSWARHVLDGVNTYPPFTQEENTGPQYRRADGISAGRPLSSVVPVTNTRLVPTEGSYAPSRGFMSKEASADLIADEKRIRAELESKLEMYKSRFGLLDMSELSPVSMSYIPSLDAQPPIPKTSLFDKYNETIRNEQLRSERSLLTNALISEENALKSPEAYTQPFCNFLTENPTVFHTVDYFEKRLEKAGFKKVCCSTVSGTRLT